MQPLRSIYRTLLAFLAAGTLQAQPVLVKEEIPRGSTEFTVIGNLVYFRSADSLYRTDGTAEGTIFLKELPVKSFREFNGDLYFLSTSGAGTGIWRSDGTPAGTRLLQIYDAVSFVGHTGDFLYFGASTAATGYEIYRTDGTPGGTILLKDINPGPASGMSNIAQAGGGYLFFGAQNGTQGFELWKTDGTPSGTVMVKDINPGEGSGLTIPGSAHFDNKLFFTGFTSEGGVNPWVSDGSPEGTMMLSDVDGNSLLLTESVDYLADHDGFLYFVALVNPELFNDHPTLQLWKTDGSETGTSYIAGLCRRCGVHTNTLVHKDKLYVFLKEIQEDPLSLWVTDGTSRGTVSIWGNPRARISFFAAANDLLLFSWGDEGLAFSRSDGTSAGTTDIRTFGSAWFRSVNLVKVNDLVFFSDHDGPSMNGEANDPSDAFQLMQTDGRNVVSLRTLTGISFTGTSNIVNYNGKVVFTTEDLDFESDDTRKKLWIYDPAVPMASFTLVNSETDEDVQQITNGGNIVTSGDTNYSIRYDVDAAPGSVIFKHNNKIVRIENAPPYSLAGDRSGDYLPWMNGTPGMHRIEATPYSEARGKGVAGATLAVQFTIATEWPSITLVDADTDEDLEQLFEDELVTKVSNINLRFNPGFTPGSVVFKHNNVIVRRENAAPYAIAGDRSGDYMPWIQATNGVHNVEAIPYSEPNGKGIAGTPFSIRFNICAPPCTTTGSITRDFWAAVPGARIEHIPLGTSPTSTSELTVFEGPENIGTNYATRIHGYICPPVTGNYTFWIASNDHSELWLSTDIYPSNNTRIANVNGATGPREWSRFATQRSAPILLERGNSYYIEALHKQGAGTDHIAVGWQLPDGTLERPIPGSRLAPFTTEPIALTAFSDERRIQKGESTSSTDTPESAENDIDIFPNPVPSGFAQLSINGPDGQLSFENVIEIHGVMGEIVYRTQFSCQSCKSYQIQLDKVLHPGVYVVHMVTDGQRRSRRLLVE